MNKIGSLVELFYKFAANYICSLGSIALALALVSFDTLQQLRTHCAVSCTLPLYHLHRILYILPIPKLLIVELTTP